MNASKSISRRKFQKLAAVGATGIAYSATNASASKSESLNAISRLQNDDDAPQRGGELRVALPADILGFDIRTRAQNDNPSRSVWEQVLQPLVRLETDLTYQPCLAIEWSGTDNATGFTFTLRDGVTFHNGDAFTAADVVYTFESMLDPDFVSSTAGQYSNISSIEQLDELTVRFTLESPDAEFIEKISRMGILPKTHLENVGSDEFNANPVGTGPFKFVEWVPDTRIKVERNESYWNTELPYLDSITFLPIVEDSVRIASLEAGEIDLWQRNVPAEEVDRLSQDPRFVLEFHPFIYHHLISLNLDRVPEFNQKAVRQAVAFAIDRQLIADVIGYGTPGKGPINPVSPYFNPDLAYYDYDPEKSLQILADAGIDPAQIEFTLQTFTYPDYQKVGELSYEMLKAIGFNIQLRIDDWSVVRTICYLPDASCDLFNSATGYLGPDGAMYESFHTNGTDNHQFYSNARVDELLEEGRATLDEERRKLIYDEALSIILEDSPRIFINDQTIPVISWRFVRGFVSNPMYSYAQLDRTWVDGALKESLV